MFGKGIHEIEPGKRGFKFGTYAASVTQQTVGKRITEVLHDMFDVIQGEGQQLTLRENANTVSYLLAYLYGGACSYANSKGLPHPTQSEVGDWLDEIGLSKAMEIYSESLKGPNAEAPEKEPGNTSV